MSVIVTDMSLTGSEFTKFSSISSQSNLQVPDFRTHQAKACTLNLLNSALGFAFKRTLTSFIEIHHYHGSCLIRRRGRHLNLDRIVRLDKLEIRLRGS